MKIRNIFYASFAQFFAFSPVKKKSLTLSLIWMLVGFLGFGQCLVTIVVDNNVSCINGSDGQASATASGGTLPYSFNWNTSPVQSSATATGLSAGIYTVTVTDFQGISCIGQVTVSEPDEQFTITSQPLPQTDCYGNTVEFSVSVSGAVGIVTYQWQQSPPSGSFEDINGAEDPILSISGIGVNGLNVNGTLYRVLVSDNCQTITSDQALLSINSIRGIAPAVVNSTICDGGGITYSVTSQGPVVSYQWSVNDGTNWQHLSDGGPYSGTSTDQLTISNATSAQTGSYRVSVTFHTLNQPPSDPTCIETSFTRTRNLLVRPPFTAPLVTAGQQICYNTIPESLNATPASGGSGPTYLYQWQNSTDGTTWTDIVGATSLSYSPPILSVTTHYRITATDTGTPSCGTINSTQVTITVNLFPVTSPIYHI